VALFTALIPCLVLARTTLVSREAKELLEEQDMNLMREKREADSQDNAAVLFNLNPLDNMLPTDEARGAKAASVELNQFDQLEKLAKVVEGEEENKNEPRLEKSLLNTFPFNQHHDGDHHGDHGNHGDHHGHHGDHGDHVDHGERHGEHDGHHDSEYSSASLDRSASSAPLRDGQGSSAPLRNRLSNRVKNVVANQVRQQLGQPGFGFRQPSNSFQSRQGQSGSTFPFGSVANKFRNDEDEEQDGDGVGSGTGLNLDDTDVSFNIIGQAAAQDEDVKGGRKCIDKVMMVEVTEYDDVITCDHSYDKRSTPILSLSSSPSS